MSRMRKKRGIQSDGADELQICGAAGMDAVRGHDGDTRMAMHGVVPREELLAARVPVFDAAEACWEVRPVLHGLHCDSEYGLSSDTCVRLWILTMSRSTNSAVTGFERMLASRSVCKVSVPGLTTCRATTEESDGRDVQDRPGDGTGHGGPAANHMATENRTTGEGSRRNRHARRRGAAENAGTGRSRDVGPVGPRHKREFRDRCAEKLPARNGRMRGT